jgi:hypothetical protein
MLLKLKMTQQHREVIRLLEGLEQVVENLRALKFAPLDRKIEWVHNQSSESGREALGAIRVSNVEAKITNRSNEASGVSSKEVIASTKVEYLERSLVDFRLLLTGASDKFGGGFVFLDDLYLLTKNDQPLVLGYVHRLLKDTGLWLKIGSIRYSTLAFRPGNPPVGMQLAHDAHEIALDRGIRLLQSSQEFLEAILRQLGDRVGVDIDKLLTEGARNRLMMASGGIVRDYLRLTYSSIEQARNRGPSVKTGTEKVIVEDVNKAAGSIASSKLDDLKEDAPEEAAALHRLVMELTEFCRWSQRAYFLVDSQDAELSRAMDALHHHRYAYLLEESETIPDRGSQRFNVWLLDIAQLSAQRATQQMDFDGWQEREKRRNRRLIFQPNWREHANFKQRPKKAATAPPRANDPAEPINEEDQRLGDDHPTLFEGEGP